MRKNWIRLLSYLLAGAMLLGLTACGSKRKTKEVEGVFMGVDVAKYQGTIDWQALAGAGTKFAMVRLGYRTAGEGTIVEDSNARYNLQEGSKAGIPMGGYFFSTAISKEEAEEEARWVAELVAKYPITYPIVYDCEGFDDQDSRQKSMTKEERTDVALAFLKKIEKLGYTGMFYASKSELEDRWETERIEKHYKIWVAQYPAQPYPQTPTSSYAGKHHMWQFTKTAIISGLSQPIDLNLAYFGYDGIEAPRDSTPPEEVGPDPEALMTFTEVEETVTAKGKTNLRSIPDQGESSKILFTLLNGQTAQRTATSPSGWSRLLYNGQVCYAVTNYLTTDLDYDPATAQGGSDGLNTQFETANDRVTAKEKVNLRSMPSVDNPDSQVVAELKNGDIARRTGISSNGWSRIEYNNTPCYAVSSYLVMVDENGKPLEDTGSGEIKTQFEEVDDLVTPKEKVNLRSIPSVDNPDSKVVATITSHDTVKRTGINRDVGWSRVEYNGQTLYCVTRYLNEAN